LECVNTTRSLPSGLLHGGTNQTSPVPIVELAVADAHHATGNVGAVASAFGFRDGRMTQMCFDGQRQRALSFARRPSSRRTGEPTAAAVRLSGVCLDDGRALDGAARRPGERVEAVW